MLKTTDTLYYDGNCPLCMNEMKVLTRLKNDALNLINIHEITADSPAFVIDKSEMLSILHLQTENGIWLKGLDATVRAWRHTFIGRLFTPLRWPLISKIADAVYYRWAEKRACHLGYSNQCAIATGPKEPSSRPPTT